MAHHGLQFACAVVWISIHAPMDGMRENLDSLEKNAMSTQSWICLVLTPYTMGGNGR